MVRQALQRLPETRILDLLHCVDVGPRHEVQLIQEQLFGRHHGPEEHLRAMTVAEEEHAGAVLEEAATAATRAGFQGECRSHVLHGRPEREIVQALSILGADVVALYPRPLERRQPPGPHSIGHVARFIVDHAPCDVLLLIPIPREGGLDLARLVLVGEGASG
jgi:nucleotide-binding universal stress UspA family protein